MGVTLPRHAVDLLRSLNETKAMKSIIGDGKYVEILMKAVFNINTIRMASYDSLSRAKISFIKGKKHGMDCSNGHMYVFSYIADLFMARLQSAKYGTIRLERFKELVEKVCSIARMEK